MKPSCLFRTILLTAILASLGSCSGGNPEVLLSDTAVALAPADTENGVLLDAAVSATFSNEITPPTDWKESLILRQEGSEETLCSEIVFDTETRIATCEHAQLKAGARYALIVTGMQDASALDIAESTASFATIDPIVVQGMELFPTGGTADALEIELAFVFSAAVPEGLEPVVQVTSPTDDDVTVGTCMLSTGRTALICPVAPVISRGHGPSYTVTLQGNAFTSFATSFLAPGT